MGLYLGKEKINNVSVRYTTQAIQTGGRGATVKVTNLKRPGYSNELNFSYWEFGSRPGDIHSIKKINVNKGESVMVDNVIAIDSVRSTTSDKTIDMVTFQSPYWFPYSDSAEFIADPYCLTGDTFITLADKTTKRIDQMQVGDKILSYDPHSMKVTEDIVTYTDAADYKCHTEYDIWTFSDGHILKTVHKHRFYNIEKQAMVYMDEWKVGDHGITVDGKQIELLSHKKVHETVRHYTIFTKNQNYFANGVLSGNRYTLPMNIS